MKKSEKKIALVRALRESGRPLDSEELYELLNGAYSIRTIRRWLHELIEDNVVQRTGQKRSVRYFINEAAVNTLSCQPLAEKAQRGLAYVLQPIYERDPKSYSSDWLENYQPNKDYYLSSEQRHLLKQQGQQLAFGKIAGTYARHIYHRLLIDLSYNSSRLEGNTYSLLDTEKLLLENRPAENKLDAEKVMILNHKEAIRFLVENAGKLRVDEQTICTLHYLLSEGLLLPEHCGKLRKGSVKIGGSVYYPIDHSEKLHYYLQRICSKAALIEDSFEKSFFLLVHLSYLQAFEDCNKRTARLSANIPLIQNNLVPISFNEIPKDDYLNAMLAVYELNNISALSELYCFSYKRGSQTYTALSDSMEFDEIRVRYRELRRKLVRDIISQRLKGEALEAFILREAQQNVPELIQSRFIETLKEDVNLLDESRIIGMGISKDDFYRWKKT